MTGTSSSMVGGERPRPIHLAIFTLGGIGGALLLTAYGLFPNTLQNFVKDVFGY